MRKLFQLNKSLLVVLIISYLLVLLIYGYWDYNNTKKDVIAGIDNQLYNFAATLKYVLPDDLHDRAVDADAISADEDRDIAEKLTRLIKETVFKYAYTIVKKNDALFFVASDITADPESDRGTFYFYKYEEAEDSFFQAFNQKEPTYKTVSDQWGAVRTVMIPEHSKGGVPYLACADIDIGYVDKLLRKNLLVSVFVFLFFLLLAVPIIVFYVRLHGEYSASLKESTQRFDLAMEATKDGLWDWNILTNEIYYSPSWKKMLGYEYDELPNDFSIWEKLTTPADVERSFKMLQELISRKRERFEIEFQMKHKEGHWIDILSRANAFFDQDGNAVRMVGTHVDITERKKVVEALLRSEERNRLLLEQVNAVVWSVDRELNFTSSRGAGLKKLNLKPDQIVGRSLFSFLGENTDLPVISALKKVLEGESITYEETVGGYIWESHAEPLKNSAGDIVGSIVLSLDITEQKKIETALKESEEKFRLAFDASPDAVNINRLKDGLYVEINEGFSKLSGYTRDDVIGRTSRDIDIWYDSKDRQKLVHGLQQDGHYDNLEAMFRCKDGCLKTALMSARVISLDNTPHIISITRDITDRIEAEEALRKSETKYRRLFDKSVDAIFIVDKATGRYLDANRSAEILTGRPLTELKQTTTKEVSLVGAEDQLRRIQQNSESSEFGEVVYTRPDGSKRTARLHSVELDEDTIFGIAQDVTDQKNLENQLYQALKMEAVGRLAGGVAHDFNNMLSVILGHAGMAEEELDHSSPLRSRLREIIKAGERSVELTRQLLAFARKQTISPKVIDLNETLEDITMILKRLIGEDIDLAWKPGAEIWPVKMDPSQIDQILTNLCINARDAISGVGKITIETAAIELDETYVTSHPGFIPGEYVLLAVSDNGCGMDGDILSNIFEPFFTTKKSGQGTGLGLAMVYGVVKQNNGFINVYSEPGQGTTFTIYLPRHFSQNDAFAEKKVDHMLERGSETVLLVEDEAAILMMTAQMLEMMGYQVLTAQTPAEAIRLANERTNAPQILMTDVVMPEMNGRELADTIKNIHPDIKCLFMSGYTANVIAHHGVLDEGVSFIQKPFSKKQLGAKVREVLDRYQV